MHQMLGLFVKIIPWFLVFNLLLSLILLYVLKSSSVLDETHFKHDCAVVCRMKMKNKNNTYCICNSIVRSFSFFHHPDLLQANEKIAIYFFMVDTT